MYALRWIIVKKLYKPLLCLMLSAQERHISLHTSPQQLGVKWEETRVLPANMVNALDLTVSQIGSAPDFIQWKLKLCE